MFRDRPTELTEKTTPGIGQMIDFTTDNLPTTSDERMKALARTAMEEGAVGISTALIYAPADYAPTEELVELAKVVAEYDGLYISHMRSEGSELLEALDELFTIVPSPLAFLELIGATQPNEFSLGHAPDEFILLGSGDNDQGAS